MQLAITALAPLLSLVVVGATPKLAAAAPLASGGAALRAQTAPAAGSREERAATAAAYYEQNRTVEAALGFEGLWRDYPDQPDYLFNAAASRFAAGHFAHAIARTDEYLALATTRGAERQAAEAQRRAAVVQTGAAAVTVKLGGSSDALEIVAQFVTRDSSDLRPELVFTAAPQSAKTLQLDPGVWMVRARAAGHAPAE
jgi:tetratricopeptide (TPR) repeat protein